MNTQKFLGVGLAIFAASMICCGIGEVRAQSDDPQNTQLIPSHDTNAVIQKKVSRITAADRRAAAARARAAREAANPQEAVRRKEARAAAAKVAEARIAALRDETNVAGKMNDETVDDEQARTEKLRSAVDREATARNAIAKTAAETEGGAK